MLKNVPNKRDAVTFATMVESDLIDSSHYVTWADEKILEMPEPDQWIMDLSLARNSNEATRIINLYAYSEPFEDFNRIMCNDEYVACQWIKYKERRINWPQFLGACGKYTDGNDSREDCSYFYLMLNEADKPAILPKVEESQTKGVHNRYQDVISRVSELYLEFKSYSQQALGNKA